MRTLRADSDLHAKPRPHVLGFTSFRLHFGGVLRGDLFREHGLTVFQLELF